MPKGHRYLPLIAWGLVAFTSLFWQLGAATFWDPDEAHYAEITRELVARGDWLTPYYNDEPIFDKPVLFHWFQAVAMLAAGPTEGAARFVPALSALAIVLVTWWLGRTLVSAEVGFVAALLLTVNPAVVALARYAIIDSVFTALLFGGVACLVIAALRERWTLQYAGYVLLALATFAKGPIAVALCGLSFLVAIAVSADARQRFLRLRWLTGAALVVGLAAPWFIFMAIKHGRAFVDGYLLKENLLLFATEQYGGQPGYWFYLQVLIVGLLPWTGLALGRLYDDVRSVRRGRSLDTFEILLWVWVGAIVGFFTVSKFKLDHYVFPAAPALALLCARAWVDLRSRPSTEQPGARLGSQTIGPILFIAGLAGLVAVRRFDLPAVAVMLPMAVSVGGAAAALLAWRRRLPVVPWLSVGVMAVIYLGALVWIVPAFEERKVVPDLARWVAANAGPREKIGAYVLNRWNTAFRFYVGRHTDILQGPDTAEAFFASGEPYYVVMLEPAYREFLAKGIPLRIVYAREGLWVTSGRALWRENNGAARFVVVTRASHP
jgi:4-amino-4-deoxy-L-arabinose transferase-like glycosyltransferase